ncbi:hypothetical protein SADUNF_Sadunf16G0070900 [Salix dunnii]|uniref:Uncharacterized protein n=1 Tax=Salix dunnii TaxID=1413687 RepID=A0A835MFW1_9ROSI|nr:hypothetical protein SADUNF_Sadunf16G0070900 [Salix dunnii]
MNIKSHKRSALSNMNGSIVGSSSQIIPFSAFWLRSSVVSVLISLISDTWAIGPHGSPQWLATGIFKRRQCVTLLQWPGAPSNLKSKFYMSQDKNQFEFFADAEVESDGFQTPRHTERWRLGTVLSFLPGQASHTVKLDIYSPLFLTSSLFTPNNIFRFNYKKLHFYRVDKIELGREENSLNYVTVDAPASPPSYFAPPLLIIPLAPPSSFSLNLKSLIHGGTLIGSSLLPQSFTFAIYNYLPHSHAFTIFTIIIFIARNKLS